MLISLSNLSSFAPKWLFSYFQPILAAIFVTIATVKVEIVRDFYTLIIVLINQKEQISSKLLLYFSLIGGKKKPLNARTPFMFGLVEHDFVYKLGAWSDQLSAI